MPWYRAGTVSVVQNSNAVTGTGTAFIANARVGDAFRGPDGAWYEVTNIPSNTSMSISPNYQGASSSSGAYALAPMQGYVKDSADALRALVNQFGPVLAVLGTTGTLAGVRSALNLTNTDGLPEGDNKYFSDFRVRAAVLTGLVTTSTADVVAADNVLTAIGKLQAKAAAAVTALGQKAASGTNSDIKSLTGLTTALSVGQGGTGVTTTAALLSALLAAGAFGKSNILGSVGQSGGVPTGAIIERGSNAAGEYTRFADGTQICYCKPSGIVSASAGLNVLGPYSTPAAFAASDFIVLGNAVPQGTNDQYGIVLAYPASVGSFNLVLRNGAAAQQFASFRILVVGRWF